MYSSHATIHVVSRADWILEMIGTVPRVVLRYEGRKMPVSWYAVVLLLWVDIPTDVRKLAPCLTTYRGKLLWGVVEQSIE